MHESVTKVSCKLSYKLAKQSEPFSGVESANVQCPDREKSSSMVCELPI